MAQQTYYRWRKLYGGMGRSQSKRLKELEKEDLRLRRAVLDLTLDKMILAEAAKGVKAVPERAEPLSPAPRSQAQLRGCFRCLDGPLHPARPAGTYSSRQRPYAHCAESAGLDCCRRREAACTESGSPWEIGYCESFDASFRDELLGGEIFCSLREARILIEQWRVHYNTVRPHSALGCRPPAPESSIPMNQRPTMPRHSDRTTHGGGSTSGPRACARFGSPFQTEEYPPSIMMIAPLISSAAGEAR